MKKEKLKFNVRKILKEDYNECEKIFKIFNPNQDFESNHLWYKSFKLCVDDKIVGFGSYIPSRSESVCISFLFIHPQYQRRGAGTILMKHMIKKILEENKKGPKYCKHYKFIKLRCNIPEYYEQFGFKIEYDSCEYESLESIMKSVGTRYSMKLEL